jgi:hypothetical protein
MAHRELAQMGEFGQVLQFLFGQAVKGLAQNGDFVDD